MFFFLSSIFKKMLNIFINDFSMQLKKNKIAYFIKDKQNEIKLFFCFFFL